MPGWHDAAFRNVFVGVPRSQSWGKIWDYIFGTPKHTPATLAQIKDLDEAVFAPAPVRKTKKDSTFAPAPPLNSLNSSFLQQPEAQLLSSSLSRTFSLFGSMCRSEPGHWSSHVLDSNYVCQPLLTYLLTYLLAYLMRCCERIRRRWIDVNSTWLQYDFMDLEGKSSKILLASAWGHLSLPRTRRPRPLFQVDGRVAALLLVSKCYSRVQYAVGNAVSRLAAHSRSQKTSV